MPLELVAFLDRALPAITALAGVALGQWWQARRDKANQMRVLESAQSQIVVHVATRSTPASVLRSSR